MDKGIRPACNAKFLELLGNRENSRTGNTVFRKTVMAFVMDEYGATLAAAATHYNHAFIEARKMAATNPTLAAQLEGLGRPEDKKGGRKPKAKPVATPAASHSVEFIDAQMGIEQFPGQEAAQADLGELTPDLGEQQTVFKVCKKSDGSVVAEGLSFEQAKALVEKAVAAKKAKLYWV
jgi:hypothetical protein